MVDPVNDLAHLRADVEYLRERVDRIGDDLSKQMLNVIKEVHANSKTDWQAIGVVVGTIITIGSLIGGFAMSSLTTKIGMEDDKLVGQDLRLNKIEVWKAENIRSEMEAIAKEKADQVVKDFNKKLSHQ